MAPYSMDLRQRVFNAFQASGDAEEVAATFGVSRAWVHRLARSVGEKPAHSRRCSKRSFGRGCWPARRRAGIAGRRDLLLVLKDAAQLRGDREDTPLAVLGGADIEPDLTLFPGPPGPHLRR